MSRITLGAGLAMAITLGGCVDYRSGHHWHASDSKQWQRSDQPTMLLGSRQIPALMEWSNDTCHEPVSISTRRLADGYLHSLYLIPIVNGSDAEDPQQSRFIIHGNALAGRCAATGDGALAIRVNGQPYPRAEVSACTKTAGCCVVDIPLQRSRMKSLEISVAAADQRCDYTPLRLRSTRHFCMRWTTFGGSNACET